MVIDHFVCQVLAMTEYSPQLKLGWEIRTILEELSEQLCGLALTPAGLEQLLREAFGKSTEFGPERGGLLVIHGPCSVVLPGTAIRSILGSPEGSFSVAVYRVEATLIIVVTDRWTESWW